MLIDLHCHTKNVKKGDGKNREPTIDLFKEKVELSQVKILAITNHNYFDFKQYKNFRVEVNEHCDVWPGIELDVRELGKKSGHVLVIVNPNKVEEFNEIIQKYVNNKDANEFCITVTELCNVFNSLEVIYIPHFFKDHQLSEDDFELLLSKSYSKKRVLHEPSDTKSLGVLNANGYKSVIGSDVKDWNNYEECTFADLKYEIKGYDNFLKLLDKDVVFVKDLIEKNYHETITVYGDSNRKDYPFPIDIYNDVNIIFGDKGSGKSEIIKSLNEYYKNEKGVIPIVYKGGDKANWFENLTKPSPKDYSCDDFGLDSYEDCIEKINTFSDKLPVKLESYKVYIENLSTNKNRKKLKIISQSKTFSYDKGKIKNTYNNYNKVITFIKDFRNFEIYKENPEKYDNFIDELYSLEKDSYHYCLDEWLIQKSNYLVDNTIEKIDAYASESDGTPEVPKETGFYEFAKNRFNLLSNSEKIMDVLNTKQKNISKEFIGKIGDKGDGNLVNVIGFVNSDNIDNMDAKKIYGKKTYAKNFIISMNKVLTNVLNETLHIHIEKIKNVISDNQISDLNYFIYNEKPFILNDKEYKPSKGEMAILSLQYELLNKESEKIFLIDEPEVNLGSTYIENTIVPLIRNLGKSGKVVVIATHDANIATRTYPITSILKITDNDKYYTYQGSMFTNQLVNIENEEDICKWDIESEEYLEGGSKAFIERGNLYGENS